MLLGTGVLNEKITLQLDSPKVLTLIDFNLIELCTTNACMAVRVVAMNRAMRSDF